MIWKVAEKLWSATRNMRHTPEMCSSFEDSELISLHDLHVCESGCPLIEDDHPLFLEHHPLLQEDHDENCCRRQPSRTFSHRSRGTRRSSITSLWSRESTTSKHRRPDLRIDNVTAETKFHQPVPSPGMLSTHSMWSTSDLLLSPSPRQQRRDPDSFSSISNTNSLSNVSSTLSDRMHELVRAFSSRTQRTKERVAQPATPSSTSSYDAKSAISDVDDPPPPRNIRLGSFIPMGSQTSEAFSEADKDTFVGVWSCRFKLPKWLRKLKFPDTMEPQSKWYVSWLFLVMMAYMYNAWVIPLRGVFPYQTKDTLIYWLVVDYLCDFLYIIDILVFKVRLRFINNGIVETNRKETKKHYMRKWMFRLDVLALMPLDLFYLLVGVNPWLRVPRLLKIQTFWEFYERCDQAAKSTAHTIRIIKTMTYMLFLIHIETCGYYAASVYEGLAVNRWVYDGTGNAYIRCFYLATKTATSIGNNPKPTNELEYLFMTLYWLSGVFVFALLIGQIRDIVEAAGHVKDKYQKKMDAVSWYMSSINLPKTIQDRVREWFLYNWEQQKTLDERSLLEALPKKLQADMAISVHFNTLSKVQLFQDCDKNLLYDLVLKMKGCLFLPQDYICRKGEVGKEMYIVSQGQVDVVGGEDGETVLATLHEGSVFGEISLLAMSGGNRRTANVRCKGYTNLFTLSKADFEEAMREYPEAQKLLKKRAKKLLKENAARERRSNKMEAEEIIHTPAGTPKLLKTVIKVMDPDSNVVKQLGTSLKSINSQRENLSPDSANASRTSSSLGRANSQCNHNKAFEFGSELSLSDIPNDDKDCDSLKDDEEDELLVIEQIERNIEEADLLNREEIDKANSSEESQDSGIPNMKRSNSQCTDNTLSNQDSKDSFNINDTLQVVKKNSVGSDTESDGQKGGMIRHLPTLNIQLPTPISSENTSPVSVSRASSNAESNSRCSSVSSVKSVSSQGSVNSRPPSSATKENSSSPVISRESSVDTPSRSPSIKSEKGSVNNDSPKRKTSDSSLRKLTPKRKISVIEVQPVDVGTKTPRISLSDSRKTSASSLASVPEQISDANANVAENNDQNLKKLTVAETHEIPPENQITCAVEIHREKSRTPTSIFSLTLDGNIVEVRSEGHRTRETAL
ncbi:cyclic nucleotide-gated cation channel beta-3 isoform X2 [Patella vulgata]|uniref:cyclic nucleotide-gated cation channel beta-3 isoform X2 n=1 Tax=Patella vulgata TaxID=6465 RepID=UPI00217FBB02|nr:cyclic nucleotide-gated cation channel beta-3 isoform X2 [Patella vulgata]